MPGPVSGSRIILTGPGGFVAKMLSLTWRDTTSRWAVPVLGGTVFLGLIGVWATSSLWLFTSKGWHF